MRKMQKYKAREGSPLLGIEIAFFGEVLEAQKSFNFRITVEVELKLCY